MRVIACLLFIAPVLGLSAEVPRWALHAGQVLTYHSSGEMIRDTGEVTAYPSTREIWVLNETGGEWDLLVRSIYQGGADGVPGEMLLPLRLQPDGTITHRSPAMQHVDALYYASPLPRTEEEITAGWERHIEDQLITALALPASAESAEQFVFMVDSESMQDRIYNASTRRFVTFDTGRGLPLREELIQSQGYGFVSRGRFTQELVSLRPCSEEARERLTRESDQLFAAMSRKDDLARQISRQPADVETNLASQEAVLREARAEMTIPMLQRVLDDSIESLMQSQQYSREEAQSIAAVLGQPSSPWSAPDLQGVMHSVAGHRGEVLVLDFWYRGCFWCIKAMPQIQEVARHFEGQPVAVLGMNTDRENADAQFVVDALALSYPTVLADEPLSMGEDGDWQKAPGQPGAGIDGLYGIQTFPTLLILDREGVVRAIHVGYSSTLSDEVIADVERLLAETGSP